ncbi:MAG: cysteine peptidase family C39 domain-containing protein [Candidatus Auribacterota bacterium]
MKKVLITNIAISYCLFLPLFAPLCTNAAEHREPQHNIVYGTQTANCGPLVLQRIFASYKKDVPIETLIQQCDVTTSGFCSLSDLQNAVSENGFYAKPIETNYEGLIELKQKGYELICHFSDNKHFVRILKIENNSISFFDPNWKVNEENTHKLPKLQFCEEWQGYALMISDKQIK